MLADKRLRNIVDYPKLYDVLSRRQDSLAASPTSCGIVTTNGPCEVQTMTGTGRRQGQQLRRYLDDYDILVRAMKRCSILDKVLGASRVSRQP